MDDKYAETALMCDELCTEDLKALLSYIQDLLNDRGDDE
jgi:hypothetical protein